MYNLKYVKNTHGGVLLLVKLQAEELRNASHIKVAEQKFLDILQCSLKSKWKCSLKVIV